MYVGESNSLHGGALLTNAVSCEVEEFHFQLRSDNFRMHRKTRAKVATLNPLLTCSLCRGYLIDATTLTECLHSFCRSCLVRYLHTSHNCPDCDTLVHESRPLLNARPDRTLQSIVYKLVPGLFEDEMRQRRAFYTDHSVAATTATSTPPSELEVRGEVSDRAYVIFSDDEQINVSLEYYIPHTQGKSTEDEDDGVNRTHDVTEEDDYGDEEMIHRRYLRCPATSCIKHIKKFIKNKFDLELKYQIEITHVDDEEGPLPEEYTLMDVAYIHGWRRIGPLPLVFRVFQETRKRQKTIHVPDPIVIPDDLPASAVETVKEGPATEEAHWSNQEVARNVPSPVAINIDDDDEKCEDTEDKKSGHQTYGPDENSGSRTEKPGGKSGSKSDDTVDLTENDSLIFSPETNLTQRQLLPKLRIPMVNLYQLYGDQLRNGKISSTNTLVESLATRAMERDTEKSNSKPRAQPGKVLNSKQQLLDEMMGENIKSSLLTDADVSNNNGKGMKGKNKANDTEGHEQDTNGITFQLNSDAISVAALTSPVVPVR